MIFPDGKEREIAVFRGDKALYLGQLTILRQIIIHESVLCDELHLNYVLAHEFAHSRQWWALPLMPLLLLVPISVILLVVSVSSLVLAVIKLSWYGILGSVAGILISAIVLAVPCAFSWLMELNADFAAIETMGIETFVAIKKRPKLLKDSFYSKLIVRMTHPPADFTLKVWNRLHRAKLSQLSRNESKSLGLKK